MRSFRFLATVLAMSLTVVAQKPSASQHTGEKLSKSQSRTLAATAKTRKEHLRLARYFDAESHRYAAEAEDHITMGAQFRKNPMLNNSKRFQGTVDHCDYIAKSLKEASVQAGELAQMHEAMATDSGAK